MPTTLMSGFSLFLKTVHDFRVRTEHVGHDIDNGLCHMKQHIKV